MRIGRFMWMKMTSTIVEFIILEFFFLLINGVGGHVFVCAPEVRLQYAFANKNQSTVDGCHRLKLL